MSVSNEQKNVLSEQQLNCARNHWQSLDINPPLPDALSPEALRSLLDNNDATPVSARRTRFFVSPLWKGVLAAAACLVLVAGGVFAVGQTKKMTATDNFSVQSAPAVAAANEKSTINGIRSSSAAAAVLEDTAPAEPAPTAEAAEEAAPAQNALSEEKAVKNITEKKAEPSLTANATPNVAVNADDVDVLPHEAADTEAVEAASAPAPVLRSASEAAHVPNATGGLVPDEGGRGGPADTANGQGDGDENNLRIPAAPPPGAMPYTYLQNHPIFGKLLPAAFDDLNLVYKNGTMNSEELAVTFVAAKGSGSCTLHFFSGSPPFGIQSYSLENLSADILSVLPLNEELSRECFVTLSENIWFRLTFSQMNSDTLRSLLDKISQ